ncbi:MAG: helix-turn-helix transcriptional regulator [Bacillota bacterium]
MTVGQKLKLMRKFRDMTQLELGLAIGFTEQSAKVRIHQYEADIKIPRDNVLEKITDVLNVSKYNFQQNHKNTIVSIMQQLFWLEEDICAITKTYNINNFYNIQNDILSNYTESADGVFTLKNEDSINISNANNAYTPSDIFAVAFDDYRIMQNHLYENRITLDTYLEWKFQWPFTTNILDYLCEHEPTIFNKDDSGVYSYKESYDSNVRVYLYKNKFMNLSRFFQE